jgi:hypothetical protein
LEALAETTASRLATIVHEFNRFVYRFKVSPPQKKHRHFFCFGSIYYLKGENMQQTKNAQNDQSSQGGCGAKLSRAAPLNEQFIEGGGNSFIVSRLRIFR